MLRALLPVRLISSLAAAALAAGALAQGGAPAPGPAPAATPSPRPSASPSPSPTPTPSPSPAPARAPDAAAEQPPAALAGNWDLKIDGTTIFRFIIERTASGSWQGRWQRPDSFNSNGNAFANLRGPVKSTASMTAIAVGPMVELAFDDPRPGAVPDIFRFRLIAADAVAMGYVGTQLPPYLLVRAGADDPLGNWDAARVYRRPVPGAQPAAGAPAPTPAPTPAPAATPAPGTGAPGPAAPAPSPAAPARAATPPRVIQPSPDGRIILGPQVRFLDLTQRPATEDGEAAEGEQAAAEEAAGPASAPGPSPAAAAPPVPASSAQAPAPAPAPAPSPAPAAQQPTVDEDFLEGL